MDMFYGQKGAATKKILHFSRLRDTSKMSSVETALELLIETSGQEYFNTESQNF